MLPFRQRSGEILTLKSPRWRLDFDPRDKAQVKNSTALSYDAIRSKIRHLLLRSNVAISKSITDENKIGRRRNEIKANHGFRKFAITQMGKSRMDPEIREYLVGHNWVLEDYIQNILKKTA
ncbi:MAG: hypothetical protein DLM72_11020 [Candidatus Nitrosopolaris wilkensis]|nr:MAG: hypothetical protein DLM72_11020 [Candidatus Nitrosopolaris wilkensis]